MTDRPDAIDPRSTLIARIEAAQEGSRGLDEAIALHLYPGLEKKRIEDAIVGAEERWYYLGTHARIEHYTTSIDAALTLVPDRYWWGMDCAKGMSGAFIYGLYDHEDQQIASARAATPALAICAAALRAREAANG